MNERRVIVVLEMDTDARLDELKTRKFWNWILVGAGDVHQVQANVVKRRKKSKRGKSTR